jgi:hypothetical protein
MTTYRVGIGETPESIARRFGGTTKALLNANPQAHRVRDGKMTFLGFGAGQQIKLPAQWSRRRQGPGAPSFKVVAGGVFVDPQIALAVCQGGWSGVPSSWPSAITQQAVLINGQASTGDINYVYYDGKLYEFTSGGGNTWISRVCSSPVASKIPGAGQQIKLPAQWSRRRQGLGAPSFKVVAGGVFVDPQIALAVCQGGWSGVPSSWPSPMTDQARAINGQASDGDINYVYYDGKLYEFTSRSGGGFSMNTWISRVCSSPVASKIPGVVLSSTGPNPTTPVTPVVLPVNYKIPGSTTTPTTTTSPSSSNAVPIAIGIAALAAGVGLAYLVSRKKKEEEMGVVPATVPATEECGACAESYENPVLTLQWSRATGSDNVWRGTGRVSATTYVYVVTEWQGGFYVTRYDDEYDDEYPVGTRFASLVAAQQAAEADFQHLRRRVAAIKGAHARRAARRH